jgi:hypothetical protein
VEDGGGLGGVVSRAHSQSSWKGQKREPSRCLQRAVGQPHSGQSVPSSRRVSQTGQTPGVLLVEVTPRLHR